MSLIRIKGRSSGDIHVLSEEEKMALQEMAWHEGLSDSYAGTATESREVVQEVKKYQFVGPPRPRHRDGMGAYIVPVGGKPLSNCYIPTPGPTDYDIKLNATLKTYPRFTLGEKPNLRHKKGYPAPNKYNTSGDISWGKCRTLTLKGDRDDRKQFQTPSPLHYAQKRPIGQGPKFSIRFRPEDNGRMPGLMSQLAFQPDPRIPGPDYNASSCEWLQKPLSLGLQRKVSNKTPGPGPQRYMTRPKLDGPKWSIGSQRKAITSEGVPGPATYKIKSTIGDAPKAPLSKKLAQLKNPFPGPGPVYDRAGFSLDEPGYTMKYRWFEPKLEKRPGPATYNCSDEQVKKRAPTFYIQTKQKPTYPSNVYADICNWGGPGPSDHDQPYAPKCGMNGKSIGLRYKECIVKAPGPASYEKCGPTDAAFPRAPAFTMGNKIYKKPDYETPGPGEYDVDYAHREAKPGKSFGLKIREKDKHFGPGPTSSCVKPVCESAKGATVKSRHTPCKYVGLASSHTVPPLPKDFPVAPLLG